MSASSGKLPTLTTGNLYPPRQLQENWFSPLPGNVRAENSQGGAAGMGGQPWGFVDRCLTARTVNGLCWHEQGPRIDEKGSWGYQR